MTLFRIVDGKKYMWDGEEYDSETIAREVNNKYQDDGFETAVFEEEGLYFVLSRRVVKEVVVND